jgi:hypothetical protein
MKNKLNISIKDLKSFSGQSANTQKKAIKIDERKEKKVCRSEVEFVKEFNIDRKRKHRKSQRFNRAFNSYKTRGFNS